MNIKTLIFHGPSGSGKDTQVDLLLEKFESEKITASSVMDSLKVEGSDIAKKADEYGKKGVLYPDELVYEMFDIWLSRLDSEKKWLFVSPVRKFTQVKLFDELVSKYNRVLDLFVHFDLPLEVAIERMSLRTYCPKCKTTYHKLYKKERVEGICDIDGEKLITREDDQPEAIKKRLAWYQDDINPILSEYQKRGILLRIDASPSIQEIHNVLYSELEKL